MSQEKVLAEPDLIPARAKIKARRAMESAANAYRFACETYAFLSPQPPIIDKKTLGIWAAKQVAPFTLANAADCLNLQTEISKRGVQSRIGRALAQLGCARFEKKRPEARHWYAPPEGR